MDITRIVIKGESGYGPYDEAYKDKVTITPVSISYEYNPNVESKLNPHHKWSYKTDSQMFAVLFKQVADMAPRYLYNSDDILNAVDIGPTEIIVTFEDKHRESAFFFCPSEFFAKWFQVIKKMVPGCEKVPIVLQTLEDIEEE